MLENNQKEIILLQDLGMQYPNETSKQKKRYGLYRCECGNEFKSPFASIKNGHTKSCGCLKKTTLIQRMTKHRLRDSRLYSIWANMKNRCFNKNTPKYNKWGGRGITICDEWKNDFMSFYNWAMSKGYQDGLSIDRINNDGNYEPLNCRWTTMEVQQRNKRILQSNNTSGYRGVSFHRKEKKWIAFVGINKKKIHIGVFKNALEAAKAYDKYVIDNKLEHTINGV